MDAKYCNERLGKSHYINVCLMHDSLQFCLRVIAHTHPKSETKLSPTVLKHDQNTHKNVTMNADLNYKIEIIRSFSVKTPLFSNIQTGNTQTKGDMG